MRVHQDKAMYQWAYPVMSLSDVDMSDRWKVYDSQFRQQWPCLEKADFERDQDRYKNMMLSGGVSRAHRTSQVHTHSQ